jgi:hypothetical protein
MSIPAWLWPLETGLLDLSWIWQRNGRNTAIRSGLSLLELELRGGDRFEARKKQKIPHLA